MPMLERNHRDSTVLPTMKCAQCNQDVHIRLIGQHDCTAQPPIPSLPPALMARGLSSFFRPPPGAKPSQRLLATEEADEFDFDEMLHNAELDIPSCENGRPAVGRGAGRIPLLPMFSGSNSSASVDSFSPGSFSPLEISRVPGDNVYIPAPPVAQMARVAPAAPVAQPLPSLSSRAEPPAMLTRLDHARDELMQASRGMESSSFMSPDSVSSFESSPVRAQASGNTSASHHPFSQRATVNNCNNGHRKTGSIAITAFPPVSPPEAGRRNKEVGNEATAAAIVPPMDHQPLGIGGPRVGDTQIRLSSRKAHLPASLSPETTTSLPSSVTKSDGLALLSTMMPERNITRNATAPISGSLGASRQLD
ncbi:hypothetical protein H4S07_005493, partial [Coemansia furcata]